MLQDSSVAMVIRVSMTQVHCESFPKVAVEHAPWSLRRHLRALVRGARLSDQTSSASTPPQGRRGPEGQA